MSNFNGKSMKYIVFFDKRFLQQSINELRSILGESKILKYLSDSVIIVDTGEKKADLKAIYDSVFLYKTEELIFEVEVASGYSALEEKLASVQKEKGYASSKTEVLKEAAFDERNAKSIEVEIGTGMEKYGARIDLLNPGAVFHVIINGSTAYVSIAGSDNAYGATLDYFRNRNMDRDIVENGISRAEFKIHEAIDYFNIKVCEGSRALDIGAAPGGWSRYLMKKGADVVAIDAGRINYEAMPQGSRIAVALGKEREIADAEDIDVLDMEKLDGSWKGYDLLHIKELFGNIKISELVKLGPFDIMCIDINIPAQESAIIAAVCSEALKKGAFLILTLKMTDDKIEQAMAKSKEALGATYEDIRVKKLPHDRKELTLFAVKI
jgi:23S rRNA (cytidine2498-2'-O)-methyltransferase